MLMNVAKFGRKNVPLVASQLNIRPVFDVNADVRAGSRLCRGRDRQGAGQRACGRHVAREYYS